MRKGSNMRACSVPSMRVIFTPAPSEVGTPGTAARTGRAARVSALMARGPFAGGDRNVVCGGANLKACAGGARRARSGSFRPKLKSSMALKVAIVGLPNVGKSTLFNALTETAQAQAANYPFCTIEPNVGDVAVPEPRLDALAKIAASKEIIPARINFLDVAGLVRGA